MSAAATAPYRLPSERLRRADYERILAPAPSGHRRYCRVKDEIEDLGAAARQASALPEGARERQQRAEIDRNRVRDSLRGRRGRAEGERGLAEPPLIVPGEQDPAM